MQRLTSIALFAMCLPGAPTWAQAPMAEQSMAAPKCPAEAEPLPSALEGWKARHAFRAAADSKMLDSGKLALGAGVDLQLEPTPKVAYLSQPEHPGGSVSHGGMLTFTTPHDGTVRIAIGSGAWLDLLDAKGNAIVSSAHGHGPACSGIRKMVDFPLKTGTYVLQISGNGSAVIPLIVAQLD